MLDSSKVGKGGKWYGALKTSWLGVAPVSHLVRSPWNLVQSLGNQDLGSVLPGGKARNETRKNSSSGVKLLQPPGHITLTEGTASVSPLSNRDNKIPSAYTVIFY